MTVAPKPIKYATCVVDLKKHYDLYVKPDKGVKTLLVYADKLYEKMIQNRQQGEQEAEYIFGMAFVENIMNIKKRPEFKKDRAYSSHAAIGKLVSVFTELETLKSTLEKRYLDHAKSSSSQKEAPKKIQNTIL